MMKMGKRALLVAAGCMLLLSGCTKSNIVQPDASQAEEPDFNVYNNIELDMDQFHDEVNEICLDENDYPMADSLDFTIDEDKALIDVTIVVKDGTYYLDDKGNRKTSYWLRYKGDWYFFGEDGQMVTDTWVDNYHVGEDGQMDKMR